MRAVRILVPLALVAALAACSGGKTPAPATHAPPAPQPATDAAPWPLPDDAMQLVRDAGLTPQTKESFDYHVHAHLDVFVNGKPVTIPGGIGIDIASPAVKKFDTPDGPGYGGIDPACPEPCISPLHTHDPTGVIHIEASNGEDKAVFTLGRLFDEWGVKLDGTCVGGYCKPDAAIAVYLDGSKYTMDVRDLPLANHEEIAIVIGSPPAGIPSEYSFGEGE